MDHAVGWMAIRCASDVGRNHTISHAEAPHAIDLHSKKNEKPALLEFAGKLDHCRTPPAVTTRNDARLPLLIF